MTKSNRQVYYQGYHIRLPSPYGGHRFYRTITDEEFMLTDITSGQVVFSFPLPMIALHVKNRYIDSYSIHGVSIAYSMPYWDQKILAYKQQFTIRQGDQPEALIL